MRRLIRTRIALRSTVYILAMAALVGIPILLLLSAREQRRESARQQASLLQLFDTVERTAQIACFVGDGRLAEEVGLGLLKHPIVGQVTLEAGGRRLTRQTRPGWEPGPAPSADRDIHSPFDQNLVVGRMVLEADGGEIARQTAQRGRATALLLASEAVAVFLASVIVVVLLVTRPISKLSRRLHSVQAETGETLPVLRGHESDEIGRLVTDVNALIDRLSTLLQDERALRDEIATEHAELERTLAEVKTLQGLLPICAWCKKIRDDAGLWTQIEQYVSDKTDARFTHGLCPECAKAQMAQYRLEKGDEEA